MNEIIEKTRELGELIQNSEEMKNAENEPCTRYAKQQDFA